MKTLLSLLLGLFAASFALAESEVDVGTPKRTPEDLRKLLAPIALYPDALIALILPASTNSADLVLAARFLASQGDAKEIENQAWDESVKSLARYPEVIKWMDENLVWTTEVGEAFAAQPADVMSTVQTLRTEAQAAGLLTDTPEQKVVIHEQEVSIQPAQEDVIYVPYYDPDILLVQRPVYGPWLSFGAGFAVGSWLNYDCDWRTHRVVVIRQNDWRYRPDWRWHDRHHNDHVFHEWRPSDRYRNYIHSRPHREFRPVPVVVRPHHFDSHGAGRGPDQRRWDGGRDSQRTWVRSRDGRGADGQNGRSDGVRNSRPDLTGTNVPARNYDRRDNGDQRGRTPPAAVQAPNRVSNPGVPVRGTDHRAPPASALTSRPVVAAPASPPVVNSIPAQTQVQNQNRNQSQERRFPRHVEAGGQRTYRHQTTDNASAPRITAPPVNATPAPQGPAPQRVGGGQHIRREAAPISPPVARQPVARQYVAPRASAPAPVSAPTPPVASPAAAPAAVQRSDGGSRNSGNGSRGADRGESRRDSQRTLR